MLEHLQNPIRIINGRIVEVAFGKHTLRDSWAILPLPLRSHDKGEIDYRKFEREVRHLHRSEISRYLDRDCESLFEWVSKFRNRFGDSLTIGSTALKELSALHPWKKTTQSHDKRFRGFYFGGRVSCFERGEIKGDWRVFDVNSMYPYVMKNFQHPCGTDYKEYNHNAWRKYVAGRGLGYFVDCVGFARQCFPIRGADGSLQFPESDGRYFVSGHEFETALDLGLFEGRVLSAYVGTDQIRFDTFVEKFAAEKLRAELDGDKAGRQFAKLISNSAYGKFGQNPDNYCDYFIRRPHQEIPDFALGWQMHVDYGDDGEIWRKPSPKFAYKDVCIAASITGASRAVLLRALHGAKRPIYCDTDSIIAEEIDAPQGIELGEWKTEAEADTAYIAAKKIYALTRNGEFVKWASKGVKIEPSKIVDMVRGKSIMYLSDAPNFKLDGSVRFVKREVKQT